MNPFVLQRLTAIQQVLLAHRAGFVNLPNASFAGEVFTREFLEKVFPHLRCSSGVITDSSGRLSGQVEIAVELGFAPSFPMPHGSQRLFMAEAVTLVVDVRSNLTKQWPQVRAATASVKKLRRALNQLIVDDVHAPSVEIPVIAIGYTGAANTDDLANQLAATPVNECPDGALVIDSGAFSGFGLNASGAWGLHALVLAIDGLCRDLLSVRPKLEEYAK